MSQALLGSEVVGVCWLPSKHTSTLSRESESKASLSPKETIKKKVLSSSNNIHKCQLTDKTKTSYQKMKNSLEQAGEFSRIIKKQLLDKKNVWSTETTSGSQSSCKKVQL